MVRNNPATGHLPHQSCDRVTRPHWRRQHLPTRIRQDARIGPQALAVKRVATRQAIVLNGLNRSRRLPPVHGGARWRHHGLGRRCRGKNVIRWCSGRRHRPRQRSRLGHVPWRLIQARAGPRRRRTGLGLRRGRRRLKDRLLRRLRRNNVIATFGAGTGNACHLRRHRQPGLAVPTGELDHIGIHERSDKRYYKMTEVLI